MGPERQLYGIWLYTTIGVALVTVLLDKIRVYINRRQNMVTQYIETRSIMDLCLVAEQRPE